MVVITSWGQGGELLDEVDLAVVDPVPDELVDDASGRTTELYRRFLAG